MKTTIGVDRDWVSVSHALQPISAPHASHYEKIARIFPGFRKFGYVV